MLWRVQRYRNGEAAPSASGRFEAGTTNVALVRFLERHGHQAVGTTITVEAIDLAAQGALDVTYVLPDCWGWKRVDA